LQAYPGQQVDAHGTGEHRAQPKSFNQESRHGNREGRPKQSQEHIDDLLDEALEETFPASDAVSIYIEHHKDTAVAEPKAQEIS
jgi:hypothetical protein